jgi:hypothetical protein
MDSPKEIDDKLNKKLLDDKDYQVVVFSYVYNVNGCIES